MHGISLLKLLVWLDWLVCFDLNLSPCRMVTVLSTPRQNWTKLFRLSKPGLPELPHLSYNQVSLALKLVSNWVDETLPAVFMVWQFPLKIQKKMAHSTFVGVCRDNSNLGPVQLLLVCAENTTAKREMLLSNQIFETGMTGVECVAVIVGC